MIRIIGDLFVPFGDNERMLPTPTNLKSKCFMAQVLLEIQFGRNKDVFVAYGLVTCRTGGTETPSVDFILCCQCQTVAISALNVRKNNSLRPWKFDRCGDQNGGSFRHALLAGFASVDSQRAVVGPPKGIQYGAIAIQGHGKMLTGRHLDNVFMFECFDLVLIINRKTTYVCVRTSILSVFRQTQKQQQQH